MLDSKRRELAASNAGIAYAVVERFGIVGGPLKDEAVSVALLALCEAANSYDGESAKFSTWAWLKVHWALVSWVVAQRARRKHTVAVSAEPDDCAAEGPGPDECAADAEFRAAVARALHRVPSAQRITLIRVAAHMVAGHTSADIAASMGVHRNTVGKLKSQLREALAVHVGSRNR